MPKKELSKSDKKENKHFFKDFKAELKRVIWPTPKQLVNNTVAVITIVLITAIIVFVLDLVFRSVNKYGINQLKSVVGTYQEEHQNKENSNNESNEEANNEQTNSNVTDTNTTVDNTENR
ncbi:MAG: preprotein translocase subunit SecE [Clostridia bacterium]|nr:preprotein translocase subunit SecE [Clostridia bacterium]